MKIIIAPDKFKGSLTAIEAATAIENGIKKIRPTFQTHILPLADGGEGTMEILVNQMGGKMISAVALDPLFRKVTCRFGYIESKKTAIIEMAEISGLQRLHKYEYNPLKTTTFGTGELLLEAVKLGAENIILCIGGSATNDAGIGMASALGIKFLDNLGKTLVPTGENLKYIRKIEAQNTFALLDDVCITVATDVQNQLYGKNGAAQIYAAQKGATPEMILELDTGLKHFSEIILQQQGIDLQQIAGSGAAGGLGGGAMVFLNAQLTSGVELVLDLYNFDELLSATDYVITGEGKVDVQTLENKVVSGVLSHCERMKIPSSVFCGIYDLENPNLLKTNAIYEINALAHSTEDALQNASFYLTKLGEEFVEQLAN